MATTTATFERIATSASLASDSVLTKGVPSHKQALQALFDRCADEVREDRHMNDLTYELDIEIEGQMCVIEHHPASTHMGSLDTWQVWKKQVPMTEQKASEQQARLGRLFNNK